MKPPPFRPYLGAYLFLGSAAFMIAAVHLIGGPRLDPADVLVGGLSLVFAVLQFVSGVVETVSRWLEWRLARSEAADATEAAAADPAEPPDPDPAAVTQKEKTVRRLQHARRYLPDPTPEGWSTPTASYGTTSWVIHTEGEKIAFQFQRRGTLGVIDVLIVPREGTEPVTDERCAALLTHLRYVAEWMEAVRDSERPASRRWVGCPADGLPRWKAPARPPAPARVGPPASLTPQQLQARRYLPEKLPEGWTLPLAVPDGDGLWMFEIEVRDILVFVGFVVEERRAMLGDRRQDLVPSSAPTLAAVEPDDHVADASALLVRVDGVGQRYGSAIKRRRRSSTDQRHWSLSADSSHS